MMPRSVREQWYHLQPDRPTGTLRVDFRSSEVFWIIFCWLLRFALSLVFSCSWHKLKTRLWGKMVTNMHLCIIQRCVIEIPTVPQSSCQMKERILVIKNTLHWKVRIITKLVKVLQIHLLCLHLVLWYHACKYNAFPSFNIWTLT